MKILLLLGLVGMGLCWSYALGYDEGYWEGRDGN